MNLKKVLTVKSVCTNLKADTKNGIIEEMLDILCESGRVIDRETALQSLLDREKKMSTGMKSGVAIPHGKTKAVDELVACIALSQKGVDFDAMDSQPCHIFVMTLSPISKSGPHLQFIAEVSQLLRKADKRELVLNARNDSDMLSIFLGEKQ